MKSIALISPYFGKLPNYFNLHLMSIKRNPEITWIFFTDDRTKYDWPSNTKVFYMDFSEMRKRIQSKFDFKIALDRPYKLCDFKPAYGYIFSDYLDGFDFWGHCDQDLIWGNLRKFLSDEILKNYDFIYREGAFRLYRNSDHINFLFQGKGSIFDFKEVFSHPEGYAFDEALSIQRIAERNQIKIYHDDNAVADIDAFIKPLYIRRVTKKRWADEAGIFRSVRNYKYQIFKWEDGKVIRCFVDNGEIKTDEFMYIHLLKRKMDANLIIQDVGRFLILPDSFAVGDYGKKLTVEDIKLLSQADQKQEQEKKFHKIRRKFTRMLKLSSRQRKVILKKRIYFLLEKF